MCIHGRYILSDGTCDIFLVQESYFNVVSTNTASIVRYTYFTFKSNHSNKKVINK